MMKDAKGLTATQAKIELRAKAKDLLARMTPEEARSASKQIADTVVKNSEIRSAVNILTCLSFGDEVDTWDLIERLQPLGKKLFVPRSDPRDNAIHVHPFPCELEQLSFGLRQPKRSAPELDRGAIDSTLDVALILGLGFDRCGYRLGYGRGYFDRFLLGRRFPSIGLAYHAQVHEKLPRQGFDIPVSTVISEREIIQATKPNRIVRNQG